MFPLPAFLRPDVLRPSTVAEHCQNGKFPSLIIQLTWIFVFFLHLLKKVRFSDKLNANENQDAYTGCLGGFFVCLFLNEFWLTLKVEGKSRTRLLEACSQGV